MRLLHTLGLDSIRCNCQLFLAIGLSLAVLIKQGLWLM